jgi:hypothetical protein
MPHPSRSLMNTTLEKEHGWVTENMPFAFNPLQLDTKYIQTFSG